MDRDTLKERVKGYYKNLLPVLVPIFIGGAGVLSFRFLRWFGLFLILPIIAILMVTVFEPFFDNLMEAWFGWVEDE